MKLVQVDNNLTNGRHGQILLSEKIGRQLTGIEKGLPFYKQRMGGLSPIHKQP